MDFREFQNKFMFKPPEHVKHKVSSRPLVSICVQTYKHVNYIEQCLESILEQKTNFEYEILLGEDNSSDGTREICIEYAKKHPNKIRLFLHHDQNKISVNSIRTGNFNAFYNFFQATGKFIAFCEGDDFWTDPEKLQIQTDFLLKNSDYSLCFHRFKEKFPCDYPVNNPTLDQPLQDISSQRLAELRFHPLLSTVCFKAPLIRELPEEMLQVLNVDSFLLSILGTLGPAKFQENIGPTIYRRHEKGIWSGKMKPTKLKIKINTLIKLIAYHKKNNNSHLVDSFKKDLKNKYRSLFVHFLKKGNFIKAISLFRYII